MSAESSTAARSLAEITGIDCVSLDLDSGEGRREPRGTDVGARGCAICDAALRGHTAPTTTDAADRFAAYQSERFGGRYVYVCAYALLHVAAPVVIQDSLVSVLICGPAVLGGVDDEMVTSICASQHGSLLSPDAVVSWLNSLPRLSPSEATALSDTLARVAFSCCDDGSSESLYPAEDEAHLDLGAYLDYLTSMEGEKRSSMRYPVETEQLLLERVSAGDREGARELLSQIVAAVGDDQVGSVAETRSRVLELVVLLSRAAIAGGADAEQVFGLEFRSLARLRRLSSAEEIRAWLARILERFVDLVFDLRHLRYSAHLARLLRFMRDNLARPVTIADAARNAGLSAGYLGRILRSELHTTFSSYLTSLRVEEARRLLRRTDLAVGDVAARCGFPDQSYFSRVFRQETGSSPSSFRLRGRG